MLKGKARLAAAAAATVGLSFVSIVNAQPVVDGTLDDGLYTRFATQTVNTGFGDNQSELNAGYYRIQDGKLYLMLTGNVESNFNKLVLFFDTRAGGQNVLRADNPNVDFNNLNRRYAGMTFDTGFEPDYHYHYSRDAGTAYSNFAEINTNGGGLGGYLGSVSLPNPGQQGAGVIGGSNGLPTIELGYADFNIGGVTGDAPNAADQAAAEAVTSGTELVFELPSLGATGDFKLFVGINGSSHDYWSNQFLPGLAAPQGNLGGDGTSAFIQKDDPDYTGAPPIPQIGHVGLMNFNNLAGDQFLTLSYTAPSYAWDNAASGNWDGAVNWTADTVPNALDAIATLGTANGSAARTVTLDVPVRLQKITFDSAGAYTVAGTNALTIKGNPATPSVVVNTGSHVISAPLTLEATTNFGIATGAQLNVTGDMTATGQALVKTGAGVVQFKNVRANSLNVVEGTARIASNGGNDGVSVLNTLIVSATGQADLTNNGLVIDYPVSDPQTSPISGIKDLIVAGRSGGTWTGNGLTSSAAAANPGVFGVGYAEASAVAAGGSFMGQTVDATAVVVRYTRLGDANLSGGVDLDDFTALASSFGNAGDWVNGDFNYDGAVNLDDFTSLASNFGLTAPADAGRSAVPEPTALGLVGVAALGLAHRRRA